MSRVVCIKLDILLPHSLLMSVTKLCMLVISTAYITAIGIASPLRHQLHQYFSIRLGHQIAWTDDGPSRDSLCHILYSWVPQLASTANLWSLTHGQRHTFSHGCYCRVWYLSGHIPCPNTGMTGLSVNSVTCSHKTKARNRGHEWSSAMRYSF